MNTFTQMHNDYLDPDRYFGNQERPEWVTTATNNIAKLFRYFGAESWGDIYKALYKGTSCGVSVGVSIEGADRPIYCNELYKLNKSEPVCEIHVSSIIEGVDYGTDTAVVDITKKGTKKTGDIIKRLFTACNEVEREAQSIWDMTHGCDTCRAHWVSEGVEDGEVDGAIPVWKDCPDCQGGGTVI